MKTRIILISVLLLSFIFSFAVDKNDSNELPTIKVMDIPVQGSKADFVKKLKKKGFKMFDSKSCTLIGEFNGENMFVTPRTNKNEIYRVEVMPTRSRSRSSIKIYYNNLCHQFQNNKKYVIANDGIMDYSIPDDENILYEITVNGKAYQAVFFQTISSKYITTNIPLTNNVVWFQIMKAKDEDDYNIALYYENWKNKANGEDL